MNWNPTVSGQSTGFRSCKHTGLMLVLLFVAMIGFSGCHHIFHWVLHDHHHGHHKGPPGHSKHKGRH